MSCYAFWNNKGGTGKTSLAFQSVCMFAERNPDSLILAIDLCPQANLSELLLGGLMGNGSTNLLELQSMRPRKTVGGYFQERLPSPYSMPRIDTDNYICRPNNYNEYIPENIELIAGDALIELQGNAISTLANTQIPGTNTWFSVVGWLRDFIDQLDSYDYIFIDANPSFSFYTQIALAAAEHIILPVMADDSSRRAVQNTLSLVHGFNLPSAIYARHNFSTQLNDAGASPPNIHLVVKNRLTQYMGPASAYRAVLTSIDAILDEVMHHSPHVFSFSTIREGCVEIRDFQTTGVVAYAKGIPFTQMSEGVVAMPGRNVRIKGDYLQNCIDAMNELVGKI